MFPALRFLVPTKSGLQNDIKYNPLPQGERVDSSVVVLTRRVRIEGLSAARFAVVPAAVLPFVQLDEVVAEKQVYFAVQRHRRGQVG